MYTHHYVPLIGLCVPPMRPLPLPFMLTTLTVGVLLPGDDDAEPGEEGLIAMRFGICDTFSTVGALGSVGADAKRGVGGDDFRPLPLPLSTGLSII